MTYRNFRLDLHDGIATVTWDMPGRSMNVFDLAVMDELDRIVTEIGTNPAIAGAVLTSGKEAFSGGADLNMLTALLDAVRAAPAEGDREAALRRLYTETGRLGAIFRRLETCGKPVVAAINGTAVGGAFELCLACHGRIMADGERVRVGLPEVKVGLIPGAGGSQRLARLVDTQPALEMMMKGEQVGAARAKALKLVDAVVPAGELMSAARRWLKETPRKIQPWDEPGFKPPGPRVFSPQGFNLWPAANAIYRRETFDNYPAARAVLASVFEGLQLPFDQALAVEGRYFAKIVRSDEAAAMIRSLFVSMQELSKLARRPAGIPPTTFTRIGIVGAGFMGAGIAGVAAAAGIAVTLIDRDAESAARGKASVEAAYRRQASRGRMREADLTAALARIHPGDDVAALAGADLVIEAVFEERALKEDVIRTAEAVLPAGTVFGSNTSTLPITMLAGASGRPENFIGIHFFSPVDRMMLVEVIRGKKTGERALAVALDFVRAIRKTPIVVNDAHGFYTSRVVETYIGEGHRMLAEGVPAAMVENAGRMAGMPVGPLSLNDEVALDLTLKIMDAARAELGEAVVPAEQYALVEGMVRRHGRHGRKNGKGFYDYPASGKKKLWPGLAGMFPRADPDTIEVGELKQRFLVRMALETARCFEEGVLTDVREADVGSILGFGFAPFTGGTLSYIDFMGTAAFVALCSRLARRHGPRFAPNRLLRQMAKRGETFYRRFPPEAAGKAA